MSFWKSTADIGPQDHARRSYRQNTDRFVGWAVLGFLLCGVLVFSAFNRTAVLATVDDILVQMNELSVPPDAQRVAMFVPVCGSGFDLTCVVDGDTIRLRAERIRLSSVDAPELLEPQCEAERLLALEAQRRLAELLSSQPWRIVRDGTDRYGRTLARLRLDDGWVGTALVRDGFARWYDDQRHEWC